MQIVSLRCNSTDRSLVLLLPEGTDGPEAAVREWRHKYAPTATMEEIWADVESGNLPYEEWEHFADLRGPTAETEVAE